MKTINRIARELCRQAGKPATNWRSFTRDVTAIANALGPMIEPADHCGLIIQHASGTETPVQVGMPVQVQLGDTVLVVRKT